MCVCFINEFMGCVSVSVRVCMDGCSNMYNLFLGVGPGGVSVRERLLGGLKVRHNAVENEQMPLASCSGLDIILVR